MAQVRRLAAHDARRIPPEDDRPGQARVVVMRGEHDPSTTVTLAQTFSTAIAVDDADLVVDASAVTFLDASTLGVLVRVQGFLVEHSRSLRVRSPSTCVRRIFDICDLGSLIEGADDPTVADQPVTLGALETWVAVPATIPDGHRSASPPDNPDPDAGATHDLRDRRTPQLALIGVPAPASVGGDVTTARAQP